MEFARHGFKGTSMNSIAQAVGLPKANLHYYFSSKEGLYIAVLNNILDQWDATFSGLTVDDDPALALSRYIRAKIEYSRTQPLASRIFAMEVISGGQYLAPHYNQHYREGVRQGWPPGADDGRPTGAATPRARQRPNYRHLVERYQPAETLPACGGYTGGVLPGADDGRT